MFLPVLFPDLVGDLRLLFALFGDLVIVFLAYQGNGNTITRGKRTGAQVTSTVWNRMLETEMPFVHERSAS
jgi:hypothetical protein